MPRESFQADLDALRDDVLDMGGLVRDRLETAIDALALRSGADAAAVDPETVARVVDGDDEVNERYLDIESRCVDLLALQQPVAGDLRLVAASFKITTDLERIGDLAANLAERAIEPPESPTVDLRGVGEVALTMVDDALAAYETADAWACHEVADADDELDALCDRATDELFRRLLGDEPAAGASARDEGATDAAVADAVESVVAGAAWQLLVIRDLERIGDHAENVAARTLYAVEQDDALLE
jgi:phosphate transport system protein